MTRRQQSSLVFVLFFISGFCSLLYQLVWLRLTYSHFGVITPNLSIVLSVFMAGIGLGSWGVARHLDFLCQELRSSPLQLYALSETFIGLGAFLVPILFQWAETILLSTGESNSITFLFLSGILITLSLLPWCTAMGASIPLMMAYLNNRQGSKGQNFSFLYLANVTGAIFGTLITSLLFIELLGIGKTSMVGGCLNFGIALFALWMSRKEGSHKFDISISPSNKIFPNRFITCLVFFTGFVAMGQEVVLTRLFTPIFGTTVYAFSMILTTYLLLTSAGTMICWRAPSASSEKWAVWFVSILPFAALLLVLLNDVRFGGRGWISILSVTPFFLTLGFLTPRWVDEASQGSPEIAGRLYSVNMLGCILGPLAAGYIFLPTIGAKGTLLFLALRFVPFAVHQAKTLSTIWKVNLLVFTGMVFLSCFLVNTYEEGPIIKTGRKEIRRDSSATVISFGEGLEKKLLVNGIGITVLTEITKVMAHLPLACLASPPRSALVICFGMGTTYRSLLSWDIDVTAVELVPSVKKAFGYYFDDADQVLKNPHGRIVIDDGRRFLQRTKEKFDVITIDPPPPVEAAVSSLLYSTEFYSLVRQKLNEGGIMQQWFPGGEPAIAFAVARSIAVSFPHVRVFESFGGNGSFHFLASAQPIDLPSEKEWLARLPVRAQQDLLEWNSGITEGQFYRDIFSREIPIERFLLPYKEFLITDDRPYNEYYFLRRKGIVKRFFESGQKRIAAGGVILES